MNTTLEKREIKFRAWNPEIKRMSKPFGLGHVLDFTNDEGLGYVKTATVEVIMQFTGRTDITPPWEDTLREGSKELFEGDVVDAWVSRWPDRKTRGWIIYNKSAQAFQLRYKGAFGNYPSEFLHNYHFFEILGDIYQNESLIS